MSVFFTIQSTQPVIQFPSEAVAINGETIIISGEQFNKNIIKISGQNVYDPNSKFVFNGRFNENISGINNTLSLNTVGFTPSGLAPSKYRVSVYNPANLSTNYFNLKILNQPSISGFDNKNVLPGQYVKVSGSNLYPGANLLFVDSAGNKVRPSFQETGLYRVTGGDIQNYGTGYSVGNTFNLQGLKKYEQNSYAVLTVSITGIDGSLGSFNINNSGIFTVPNLNSGIEFIPNSGNGRGALINFLYEKYENTGSLEFLEFQVPYNIRKNQSGILENLKFKDISSGAQFTGFYISGYPNIHSFSPQTGLVESTNIVASGDNLSFIQSLKIGDISVNSYSLVGDTGLSFKIPNFSSSDYIFVSGVYGSDKSSNLLNVSYPQLIASGYSPNDVLAGTGTIVRISGKHLQRIKYIDLGQPKVLIKDITINQDATQATFALPNAYTTTSLKIFSVDFPSSGELIRSNNSNDLLVSTTRLFEANVDIRYLSGIQAAKYLDEIEIYSPSGTSGDYGNLTNSEVLFLGITGNIDEPNAYSISGIKVSNSATGIRFKVPREVRNPQARIKIKRNKFGESYILPSNKSIDILPTIYDISNSNTTYNNLGFITISGINASNVNEIYFSGYQGTTNIFGFKDLAKIPLEIVSKNLIQITGESNNTTGYTVIEAKLGGDVTGIGEVFLFNEYYDTGIGYENQIITKGRNIKVSAISGFRPQNSDIFTSPSIVSSPLDQAFFYQIQTNSRATQFEISATTISGIGDAYLPPGINANLNSSNQIFGAPTSGGNYYIKIRAINGERPNEGMILQTNFGASGRSLAGAGIVYRGEWDPSIGYVGDGVRRDVVNYPNGANYWYAATTNTNSTPGPTNPNWIAFSNEFSATSTQISLSEQSNITSILNIGRLNVASGVIKSVNDIDSNLGSGFFLGYDNSYNPGKPKFRVGNSDNYIKFNGLGLDIVGPLSGILTTSRNILNSNNVVNSEHSVALGLNNLIESGSNNVFIFGTNNTASNSRRSSIIAGQANLITGLGAFISQDSNIVGGENNKIIGSFCNIGGGKNNIVDALSTGLAGIGNQIFSVSLTGEKNREIIYPLALYTNQLGILQNIKKTGEQDFYDIKLSNVTSTQLDVEFASVLDSEDLNIDIFSWISVYSQNLYSGSFGEDDKVSQFKVFSTGIASGVKDLRINFQTPFDGTDNIVVLNTLQSQDFYKNHITGVNRSGFNIVFSKSLDENVFAHFFAGNIGNFTGIKENLGKILEVGSVKPFANIIFGTGANFDIPIDRSQYIFQNVYKPDSNSLYIAKGREIEQNKLKIVLNNPIDPKNEYILLDAVSYTGTILNHNLQVYNTGLNSGLNTYSISLLSGIPESYIPIVDEIISGNNFYPYATSNHTQNQFNINFGNNLVEDVSFNVGIYRSGKYAFDSGSHFASSKIISGSNQNIFSIPFDLNLRKRPRILFNLENINNNNFYVANIEDITKTGFSIKLSNNLSSGEQLKINYLAVEGTGHEQYNAVNHILGYETFQLSKEIVINTENSASQEVKVFGRATSDNNLYYHIFTHSDPSRFDIKISDTISGQELKDLNFDYILTDLTRDLVLTRNLIGESAYGRLAGFGFDDVGSSTIGGGTGNFIKGLVSVIGGGVKNTILGDYNVIPGGRSNSISDFVSDFEAPKTVFCGVVAGNLNVITGNIQNAVILGGESNNIENTNRDVASESFASAIVGGKLNTISGSFSAILGGTHNNIRASYSYGVGRNIDIDKSGCMVLGDSTPTKKINLGSNTLTMHFASGIYITGVSSGVSPINLDLNNLPTGASNLPVGAIYRSGDFLKIKLF